MQGTEVETGQETGQESPGIVSVDAGISPLRVRLGGLALFALLISLALLSGIMYTDDFTEIIADVWITIPLVAGSYFLRFALQYAALLLFSGIGSGQIRVGFSDRNISPFVHARRPYELGRFRVYLLLPVMVMSLIPFAALILFPHPVVYVIATYTVSFCINDLLSFIKSLRFPSYMLAADHPSQFGFVLYDNPFYSL